VHLRSDLQMREYAEAVQHIVADSPGRLLDWGCGFGQLSHMLKERGVDVTSIEWDPEVPEGAVRRLERYPDVEATYTRETVRLPYEDASFDSVLSMGVLEHVQEPGASLDELHRVLRPGGRLYVYKLPNRFSYLEKVAKRGGLYYHGQLEHDRLYTPAVARALVEGHGFRIEDLRLANMVPLGLTSDAARRAAPTLWRLNTALSRVPGLNRVATNVQLVARRVP
jgi:2-polyprenyl-3-methyl-5-hydroxy-6-metoxy-1,4-benzoquinol methylase